MKYILLKLEIIIIAPFLILTYIIIYEFRKQRNILNKIIQEIRLSVKAYNYNLNHKSGYFTHYAEKQWIQSNVYLIQQLSKLYLLGISSDIKKDVNEFKDIFKNSSAIRYEYNQKFVEAELIQYHKFFNDIEGRKLDLQQRKAIIIDESNNLVVAGAGSGKTTCIVGKVNYVLDKYNVLPSEILTISFTKKSSETLSKRLRNDIEVKTFHKLGFDIIKNVEKEIPSIFDSNQYNRIINNELKKQIKKERYKDLLVKYFLGYLKEPKSQFDFKNHGDYIQYMKDQSFRTYREKFVSERTTYKREVVKSIEECLIANFLLMNNIHYEYEHPYEYKTSDSNYSQYKPDFKIMQGDITIYLEHFGVDREGNVPEWFGGENAKFKYNESIQWKRNTHKYHLTTLIETYSYEASENKLLENLKLKLEKRGIVFVPKSASEQWEIIKKSSEDEIESFTNLIGTFITLLKSNGYSIKKLQNELIDKNSFRNKRTNIFLELVTPIYESYEKQLKNRNEIDFNDMINLSCKYINEEKCVLNLKYIIIDEFQDISIGRYNLIKAIQDKNPNCRIYCVGDDWQSIYRFTGSDISLLNNFESYFGFSSISKIETTYRFKEPLINISSDFICKNPNQIEKNLKVFKNEKYHSTFLDIKYSMNNIGDDTQIIIEILNELNLKHYKIEEKKIMILGRYNFDIDRVKNSKNILEVDKKNEEIIFHYNTHLNIKKKIKIKFMTVHKAKGLESDIVIVLNCNSGKHGFPSELSDDSVLNLLLSGSDDYENSEERRIFYVALTRAKEQVYLVSNVYNKSKFIMELETRNDNTVRKVNLNKCPKCKKGDILQRKKGISSNRKGYIFKGCSNYLYGCNFTEIEWLEDQNLS